MCWCWSTSPKHRPNFTQIKEIISTDTFTQLLDSNELVNDSFTTASLHVFKQQYLRRRYQEDNLLLKHSSASPSPSVLHMLAASTEEEETTKVYYGTERGRVGTIQFFATENSYNVS